MENKLERLTEAVIDLDEATTLSLAKSLLAEGFAPLAIVQAGDRGMRVVGERYERQEYFLSALIVAGEIFKEVIDLVQPDPGQMANPEVGRVLLGTVAGDIHDLGKSIFASALRGFDFNVRDIGVDVSPQRFLAEARSFKPDILCLSGLITPAIESMRDTIKLFRTNEPELGKTPVVVGGNVDNVVGRFVGADSWTTDAMEGVRICLQLMGCATDDDGGTGGQ